MLKIRFKRSGRKKQPFYKIVVMDVRTKRDGKALEELGFYNPITKTLNINCERTIIRLKNGVQPTEVVKNLLRKSSIF
uniref:Small ribosomal subunit protein bS16c n=6 Tax=Sargassum TaxID=3015 RepID=A0A6B9TNL7_SARFS|nr:ribosomal protein S16 [Sargassum thunbergii]YP_009828311.1 ribosomal protein S16 [Sargassum fusiforme]YP_010411861.1 ribosomal protein S16 [Sargassum siliquastrum]YP_010471269.1 30S ribosomal protein S16 [Sargassum confusum]YP_010485378.1 30S ribosomal protein S16 [Sargassum macrocarpum]YP_010485517.1 30S ribosomal protein S16 [Sargassum serratifolium]QNO36057.1 ribsomal protein S16 [Sargassum hemiphyllum var. chinense]QXI87551.1 ribosomal protein S16 [Sargassum muticum]UEP18045.1 riboso